MKLHIARRADNMAIPNSMDEFKGGFPLIKKDGPVVCVWRIHEPAPKE